MATKKQTPFTGKESKREEAAEKRMSKAAYARGEKKEGTHGRKGKGPKPC